MVIIPIIITGKYSSYTLCMHGSACLVSEAVHVNRSGDPILSYMCHMIAKADIIAPAINKLPI